MARKSRKTVPANAGEAAVAAAVKEEKPVFRAGLYARLSLESGAASSIAVRNASVSKRSAQEVSPSPAPISKIRSALCSFAQAINAETVSSAAVGSRTALAALLNFSSSARSVICAFWGREHPPRPLGAISQETVYRRFPQGNAVLRPHTEEVPARPQAIYGTQA